MPADVERDSHDHFPYMARRKRSVLSALANLDVHARKNHGNPPQSAKQDRENVR